MPRKATRSGPKTSADQGAAPARRGRGADDPVTLGLRKLWEHVEKEPVPDAFLALLDQIDAARAAADNADAAPDDAT